MADAPVPPNRLKRKLAANEACYSVAIRVGRTTDVIGIAAAAGYDAVYLDMQHSGLDLSLIGPMAQLATALGVTPLVRVADHTPSHASRALDVGAMGIIFPDVEDGETAQRCADACRYPPEGKRSASGSGPQMVYRPVSLRDGMAAANAECLVIAMIESQRGADNAAAIAAVPGVDALLVGTNDLSANLGVHGEHGHAKVRACYEKAIAGARAAGKPLISAGIASPDILKQYVAMGASRCCFLGTDAGALLDGLRLAREKVAPVVG